MERIDVYDIPGKEGNLYSIDGVLFLSYLDYDDCDPVTGKPILRNVLIKYPSAKANQGYEVPNGTEVLAGAFDACPNIKYLYLPDSLVVSKNTGTYNCPNIEAVYYQAEHPVEFKSTLFLDETYRSATLYVPYTAVTEAKKTMPWSLFKDIQGHDFSGIEYVVDDLDINAPVEVYNLNGVKLGESTDNLPAGIYILHQGSTIRKVAIQ